MCVIVGEQKMQKIGGTIFVVYPPCQKFGKNLDPKFDLVATFCSKKNGVWRNKKTPTKFGSKNGGVSFPRWQKKRRKKFRCEGKAESIERLAKAVICRGISPIRKRGETVAALKMVGPLCFHENFLVGFSC